MNPLNKMFYDASKQNAMINAERYFGHYRRWSFAIMVFAAGICVFTGEWIAAAILYGCAHFHMLIGENYWQIKNVQHHMENNAADKDDKPRSGK